MVFFTTIRIIYGASELTQVKWAELGAFVKPFTLLLTKFMRWWICQSSMLVLQCVPKLSDCASVQLWDVTGLMVDRLQMTRAFNCLRLERKVRLVTKSSTEN